MLTMIDVINLGASRRRIPHPCPCCGADAPLASIERDGYSITCETDGCKHGVEGDTLAEVWDFWNDVAALHALGSGGIK